MPFLRYTFTAYSAHNVPYWYSHRVTRTYALRVPWRHLGRDGGEEADEAVPRPAAHPRDGVHQRRRVDGRVALGALDELHAAAIDAEQLAWSHIANVP